MANFVNTRKNFPVGNADATTRFLGLCNYLTPSLLMITEGFPNAPLPFHSIPFTLKS